MLLPRGVKLIQETELEKLRNQPKEQCESLFDEEQMPDVIIDRDRATSRQLALKEKEALKKIRDKKKSNQKDKMFKTPKKKLTSANADIL